ncbi:MAG: hypothetical protein N5P05_001918 [Chroococcopsis gigantea SAG 12.99]|jgi:uncharacterized protein (DUF952 family)|nr:DUF952 domain-containing protein [Chlorogloea purpurea SAG 13.99]MDV3000312.1 hypothetical protein [Chroococcopsis gigantea SAG 12.99]
MIYHITTEKNWQIARELGEYKPGSLKSEGFIHCSTEAQLPKVIEAFYRDIPNIVILSISLEKLESPVKWEDPVHLQGENRLTVAETETFPHIYGAINLEAVEKVTSLAQFQFNR